MVHHFPQFEIDENKRELRSGGRVWVLQPRVFDLLVYLAQHRDRVVPKEELLDAVWPGVIVTDASLQRAVSLARSALGEAGLDGVIRTFSRQGYRLCVDVSATGLHESSAEWQQDETAAAKGRDERPPVQTTAPDGASATQKQEIRFLRCADGTTLAYALSGGGVPLVKAANWLSHLEFDHQSPVWRHWWAALSARYHLIRYDERGCGISDWDVPDFSFDAWVRDLEEVVDRIGLGRFALLGISQGAAVAIVYAVRHPERVSHLILYGGYVLGRSKRAITDAEREEIRVLRSLMKLGWGQPGITAFQRVFASLFMPEGSREQHHAFVELQRASTSPENADKFRAVFAAIDVTSLAAQVSSPTLVIHARDDQVVPIEQARMLASIIPNAKYVQLESSNHILTEHEPAWPRFLEEVDQFVGASAAR